MTELNVKVGDKVIVSQTYQDLIATITKITPTGRMRTDKTGNTYFDKYGREMGQHSGFYHYKFLRLYTEEEAQKIRDVGIRDKAMSMMRSMRYDDLTVDQAREIIRILGEGGQTE